MKEDISCRLFIGNLYKQIICYFFKIIKIIHFQIDIFLLGLTFLRLKYQTIAYAYTKNTFSYLPFTPLWKLKHQKLSKSM